MIVCEHLSKAFGGKEVLRDFSATFKTPGVTGIMGASGVGKTTLLRILMGLEKPDSGTISGLTDRRLSVVFQEDRLFPALTALENASVAGGDGKAALDALEMGKEENAYPRELSGGMQRRVAIARAIATGGDVFLLDEPFKGLDEELREKVMLLFREIGKEKTVLLVTHDRAEMEFLADEVCEMR